MAYDPDVIILLTDGKLRKGKYTIFCHSLIREEACSFSVEGSLYPDDSEMIKQGNFRYPYDAVKFLIEVAEKKIISLEEAKNGSKYDEL